MDQIENIDNVFGSLSQVEQIAIQQQLLFFGNIINNVPHYLFWKDKNSVFLGCNELFAKAAGLADPADIVGKTDYDLPWDKAESDAYVADDQEVMHTGMAKINKEEKQTVDGKEIFLLTSKVPIQAKNGSTLGVLGIYTDITGIKYAAEELRLAKQKAETASLAKTSFLAKVSHELRTPLNGILGTTQILSNKKIDTVLKEHINDIESATLHLLHLVNDILDFTCAGEEQLIIHPTPFDIEELVKTTLSSSIPKIKNRKLRIIRESQGDIPPILVGDAFRIKQILINLLNNAIKFTAKGTIKVMMSCLEKTPSTCTIRLKVEDTGIGIPQEMSNKIFDRFFQIDSDYNRTQNGVGLGLAICKQIANAMGSEIYLESSVGKGSGFWFDVKFDLPEVKTASAENNPNPSEPEEDTALYNCYVLVVEDNHLNQKILTIMLKELGCRVDVAGEGEAAIELAKQNSYDMILMDIGLPRMDGLETSQKIREIPSHSQVPIIAVTAHAFENDLQRCRRANINDVFIKPITIGGLKNILSRWGAPEKI